MPVVRTLSVVLPARKRGRAWERLYKYFCSNSKAVSVLVHLFFLGCVRSLSSVQVSDSRGASFFFLFLLISCLCNCCLNLQHFYSARHSHWMLSGYLCKCFSSWIWSAESDLLLLPSACNLSLPSFLSHCFSFHLCLPAVGASSQRRKWGRAASAGLSVWIAVQFIILQADQALVGMRSGWGRTTHCQVKCTEAHKAPGRWSARRPTSYNGSESKGGVLGPTQRQNKHRPEGLCLLSESNACVSHLRNKMQCDINMCWGWSCELRACVPPCSPI